jgi:hypothetical protein
MLIASVIALSIASAGGAAEIRVWPVSPLERVWPDSAPPADDVGPIRSEGARGEVATAQIAIRSGAALRVRLRAGDLGGPGGSKIPASAVKLQWERRIALTRNSPGTPREELDRAVPCDVADPFWEGAEREVPGERTEGAWIEVRIPREAPAGEFRGAVILETAGGNVEVPLVLRIWGFEIPEKPRLHVTQWFTFPGIPFAKTVEPYSDRWWALLEKFARTVAEHRQDTFQAPFHLIRMRRAADGRFAGDFSRFDRWCETFFRAGPFARIELGFVARLEGGGLTDPGSRMRPGKLPVEVEAGAPKPSEDEAFRGYLRALRDHLAERGWLERSMIHIHDEPFIQHEESYREVARIVAEAAPGLRRIDAIETEDFFGSLEVWVPKLSHLANWHETAFRRAKEGGAELWFYTCCHPTGRYPNRFLDYPLLKTRVLHWIAYGEGLDGYLHWGLNHFVADDPFSEAAQTGGLPPGDPAVCYPAADGYLGSLRWSAMRDGLQDYETLRVLEDRLLAVKERLGDAGRRLDPRRRPLEICRRVVRGFREYTRSPAVLLDARRAAAEEIEAIDRGPLLAVQTSPLDGEPVPGWPRVANLWGVAEPGTEVKVGGRPVASITEKGVFFEALFLGDGQVEVAVEAKKGERAARAVRRFPLEGPLPIEGAPGGK